MSSVQVRSQPHGLPKGQEMKMSYSARETQTGSRKHEKTLFLLLSGAPAAKISGFCAKICDLIVGSPVKNQLQLGIGNDNWQ